MPLPLPPKAYSTGDQAQTRAQISQQLSGLGAQIRGLQTAVSTSPTSDLRSYAAQAGITLGQGDDQPAFDAAHAAMAARTDQTQILYVYVPPGTYNVSQLKIYTCAGFYCDPGTALLKFTPWTTTGGLQGVVFADLDIDDGASAVSWVLWGLRLNGGWVPDWTNEADPGLFHYAASEYSGGDPERTATPGQTGVYLRGVFTYDDNANLTMAADTPFTPGGFVGDPRYLVGHLEIANWAGDGFMLQGAGAGVVGPIRTVNCGGRGIVLNAFDNLVGALDAGSTGLEAIVCRSQFSTTWINCKGWFAGQRTAAGTTSWPQDAGHNQGIWLDRCSNIMGRLMGQDTPGSAFKLTGLISPTLFLNASWSSISPSTQTAVCGGVDFVLQEYATYACQGGYINLTINRDLFGSGPYTQVQYAINALGPINGTIVDVAQISLTGDTGDAIQSTWIAGTASYWDSATVRFGAAQRAVNQWLANSYGDANFGLALDGSLVGVIAKTTGASTLLSVGRGVQVQVGFFDNVANAYTDALAAQLDTSGVMQIGFFGQYPAYQPTAAGLTWGTGSGSGNPVYFNSVSNGGIGSTNYTFADVVAVLKTLGLAKA